MKAERIYAEEILDSRGNPTVQATVVLNDGSVGTGAAPSGASTGKFEAHELRDKDSSRYGGKGVLKAVENVNGLISQKLRGESGITVTKADKLMLELDGTENKTKLGANAMLSVSIAMSRALAAHYNMPLFRYIGGVSAMKLPTPMMNILNGGAHAANNIDIQEFMIMPVTAHSFKEKLQQCAEVYQALKKLLSSMGLSTAVGDEGGFAPDLKSDEEAIELIMEAISAAGYSSNDIKIALDAASSEWVQEGKYILPKRGKTFTADELCEYWHELCSKYPIISLEDPLGEEDFSAWKKLTGMLGDKVQIVGDDLFVTNKKRLKKGISMEAANAILIKPNQIGTVSETIDTVICAKQHGYRSVISHRSGETEDTFIADLSVALNSGQIKTGAPCRSERTAKYNRLLRIESMM